MHSLHTNSAQHHSDVCIHVGGGSHHRSPRPQVQAISQAKQCCLCMSDGRRVTSYLDPTESELVLNSPREYQCASVHNSVACSDWDPHERSASPVDIEGQTPQNGIARTSASGPFELHDWLSLAHALTYRSLAEQGWPTDRRRMTTKQDTAATAPSSRCRSPRVELVMATRNTTEASQRDKHTNNRADSLC